MPTSCHADEYALNTHLAEYKPALSLEKLSESALIAFQPL